MNAAAAGGADVEATDADDAVGTKVNAGNVDADAASCVIVCAADCAGANATVGVSSDAVRFADDADAVAGACVGASGASADAAVGTKAIAAAGVNAGAGVDGGVEAAVGGDTEVAIRVARTDCCDGGDVVDWSEQACGCCWQCGAVACTIGAMRCGDSRLERSWCGCCCCRDSMAWSAASTVSLSSSSSSISSTNGSSSSVHCCWGGMGIEELWSPSSTLLSSSSSSSSINSTRGSSSSFHSCGADADAARVNESNAASDAAVGVDPSAASGASADAAVGTKVISAAGVNAGAGVNGGVEAAGGGVTEAAVRVARTDCCDGGDVVGWSEQACGCC